MTNKTIETGLVFRDLSFEKKTIDVENRTVEVRFSSEFPVKRYIDGVVGDEVLDHNPQSVNLGRLNDGGPVLLDHDAREHVGIVERASIDADRVGRALLRFGKSALASEVFNDVTDGIRRSISVGYRVHKYVSEKIGDGLVFRAVNWEPYEITFTSVPADPTAQVGREAENLIKTEVITMEPETAKTPEKVPALDTKRELETIRRKEIDRSDNIRAIGEKYDCEDVAREAIRDGVSEDNFNKMVLDRIAEKQANAKPVTQIGLNNGEVQRYSLMRAINAAFNNDWSKAGFEREASIAIEDELQRAPQGFYIPFEIQSAMYQKQQRVMTVGTDADGGYLKGTDHMAGSFIELLRANALMGQLNARFLPGLTGDIDIPRLDGGVAFNWVTEDADATPDDATLGTVAMAPKTVVGEVPISRRLLKQSAPSVEAMLMDDMAKGAALAIDLAAFSGTGASGQPTGVTATAGIGATSIASFATTGYPTFAEIVAFETDVLTANALNGTLAYCTTAAISGSMKTTAKDAGSGMFLLERGEANGYPVHVSTQLAAKTILFGNFEDVIIGLWGVLDVEPDKAEKAASGGLVLRVFQDVDIGVRHAGSFSESGA